MSKITDSLQSRGDTPAEEPSLGYAWYVVGLLMVIYIFSFIDRQILSLLVGPIKRDLGISDTQMSLLMGISFALFYTLFGLPIGRLADSRSRRGIIAIGLAIWSLMTALCGVARQYWHFLGLRVGVGIGEAALSPAAYSIITDLFPKRLLATAISVYSMGVYIGSGMAFLLGGLVVGMVSGEGLVTVPLLGETRPWQLVFFSVGLPGLLLLPLLLTIREPKRRGSRSGTAESIPVADVVRYLSKNRRTFLCHNIGFALMSFGAYGAAAWVPTFLQRNHGFSPRDAGVSFGLMVMFAGSIGIVLGGRLGDWLENRGHRDAPLRVGLMASLAYIVPGVLYPLVPSPTLALVLLTLVVLIGSTVTGIAAAALQVVVPNEMRGQVSALYLFFANLIGLGLGPTGVALLTDFVFKDDQMINYSLASMALLVHVASGLLLWSGLAPFRASRDYLTSWLEQRA